MAWPIETDQIEIDDLLFMYVHLSKVSYAGNLVSLKETCFEDPKQSCDWSKYHTPEQTRDLIGKQYRHNTQEFKNKYAFFIASTRVGDWHEVNSFVEAVYNQTIHHDPLQPEEELPGKPANRAHCEIRGDKSLQIRTEMARRAKWEIAPPPTKAEMKIYKEGV